MLNTFFNISIPASLIWFLTGLLTLIFEFIAPAFILFFFGFSAIIVGLICFLYPISLNTQLILFIVSSILSLIFLRRHLKQWMYKNKQTTQYDELSDYAGKQVTVIADITPSIPGKVEFQGSSWKAVSKQTLSIGQPATIIKIENITLHVEATKQGES